MSQYTINELISILNGIKKDGLTKIDSDENVKLLIENLLAQKIEFETKNRKKQRKQTINSSNGVGQE